MLNFLVAALLTFVVRGTVGTDHAVVQSTSDGFQKNSVNVATCDDSNIIGSSGSFW